jgi:DNA-binding response OmpR family regulator
MQILIVEDDPPFRRMLRRALEDDRHLVETAGHGEAALELLDGGLAAEAVILDLGLPDITGIEVLRRLRARGSTVPVLILTARDAVADRVAGLDAGADDYLVKPFAYEELAARLRALDRRARSHDGVDQRLVNGPIALDQLRQVVEVNGRRLELTRREFNLLECLLRHPGQVLSRDQLLDLAWPYGDFVTHNTVESYVSFLRHKLGPGVGDRIETVRGFGYRMAEG